MKYSLISFVAVWCFLPAMLWAASASDSFIVRTLVGEDTDAPTTPVIISAVPMSTSQIDVTWSASTDDMIVGGYRIYRDSVVVATTTQTTFSDTGLTASTTYTYTVDAFDYAFNISSTSLPVSTTTLQIPPTPTPTSTPTTTTSATATAVPVLRDLVITPKAQEAVFDFSTMGPTTYILRWGRTSSYELGSVSGGIFKVNHTSNLYDLEPGTTYFYELELENNRNISRVVKRGSFKTTDLFTGILPTNVSNLQATVQSSDVLLTWELPEDMTGVVRVLRSHLFYPTSPVDGVLVYEGEGTSFLDKAALSERSPQYYTVFVELPNGLTSSGATVVVWRRDSLSDDGGSSSGIGMGGNKPEGGHSTTTNINPSLVPPDVGDSILLDPAAVVFKYNDVATTFDGLRSFPTDTEVTVLIPRSALAKHLKAIILTIYDPSNNKQTSTYMLRLDQNGEYYTATYRTPKTEGEAALTVEVYDFTAAVVRRIGTKIFYEDGLTDFYSVQVQDYKLAFAGGIFLLSSLFFWFLLWRRRRREDNKSAS